MTCKPAWMRLSGSVVLAGLLCLCATGPSLAETDAQRRTVEAARAWDLLGSWRIDCNDPKAARLAYAVRNGVLMHERDLGNRTDTQEVLEANSKPGGDIELVVHFPAFNQTRKYTMVRSGARMRAVSNTLRDGTDATIVAGKFVHNGGETPWQSRCNTNSPGTSGGASAPTQ